MAPTDTSLQPDSPPLDPARCHLTSQWKYDPSPLIGCRFEPLGRYLFTGGQDHRVLRWNLADGSFVSLEGHTSWVRALANSPDGTKTWTGGYDGQLICWPTADRQPEPLWRIEQAHQGWIRAVAVRPDGRQVATAGNDLCIRLWDAEDHQLQGELAGHDRHIYSLLYHPTEPQLLSGDLRGVVKRWNVVGAAELASFEAKELYTPNPGQGAEYGGVRSMALSADVQTVACAGLHAASNPFGAVQEPLIELYRLEDANRLRAYTGKEAPKAICWRVVFHPSEFWIGGCGGSAGGFLGFWKGEAETEIHRFSLPNTVYDMDLHPNGQRIATVHYDRHVRFTDLA